MTTLTITVTNFAANVLMRKFEKEGVKVESKLLPKKKITIDDVLEQVCNYCKVSKKEVVNMGRKGDVPHARHLFFYIVCEALKLRSQRATALYTGGRHASTVNQSVLNTRVTLTTWGHTDYGKRIQSDINEITKLINL